MKRILTVAALLVIAGLLAGAQQAPAKKQPQAKTKEEFEAYSKFWNAQDPDEKIKFAEEFLAKYPETELRTFAYRKHVEAYQQKNDFEKMRDYAERVLDVEPDDAYCLLLLASAIPERTKENDLDKEQKLKTAEEYANRALKAVEKMEKPAPGIPDDQWNGMKSEARSNAYAALGLVQLQRKAWGPSEELFMKAAEMQGQPDPIVWWRLGMVRQNNKKYPEALAAYEKSVSLGGVKSGGVDLAAQQRDQLKKALDDAKAKPQPKPQQ